MVSNIDPTANGYNQLFPVAGVNNSTQGYRNNFTSIFNNFTFAKAELEALQGKVLDFNQTGSDVTGITQPLVFDQNTPAAALPINLTFRPNPRFTGSFLRLPLSGTAADPTDDQGKLRYNKDTKTLQAYMLGDGDVGQWLNLSAKTDDASYILRAGDVVRGTLTFNSTTTNIIKVVGDSKVTGTQTTVDPSFTFLGETNTGLTRSAVKELSLTVNGSNRIKVTKVAIIHPAVAPATPVTTQHYVANFSPASVPNINNEDIVNTKIHGQYRGYQRSHEYFVHKANVYKDSPGPLAVPVMTFKLGDGINPASCAAAWNFDFIVAGVSTTTHAYVVSGIAIGSFVFDRNGVFVGIPHPDPTKPNFLVTENAPVVNLHKSNTSNVINIDVRFRIEQSAGSVVIIAEVWNAISATAGLDFDISGKMTVHFTSLNSLPIIIDGLHD